MHYTLNIWIIIDNFLSYDFAVEIDKVVVMARVR
jgi:hypothetical protein